MLWRDRKKLTTAGTSSSDLRTTMPPPNKKTKTSLTWACQVRSSMSRKIYCHHQYSGHSEIKSSEIHNKSSFFKFLKLSNKLDRLTGKGRGWNRSWSESKLCHFLSDSFLKYNSAKPSEASAPAKWTAASRDPFSSAPPLATPAEAGLTSRGVHSKRFRWALWRHGLFRRSPDFGDVKKSKTSRRTSEARTGLGGRDEADLVLSTNADNPLFLFRNDHTGGCSADLPLMHSIIRVHPQKYSSLWITWKQTMANPPDDKVIALHKTLRRIRTRANLDVVLLIAESVGAKMKHFWVENGKKICILVKWREELKIDSFAVA